MNNEEFITLIIMLLILVLPLELIRRWFKKREGLLLYRILNKLLIVIEILLALLVSMAMHQTSDFRVAVSTIKQQLADNDIDGAFREASERKGRGDAEIDALFEIASQKMDVLTTQRAEQKRIADAKRLVEIDKLIPTRKAPLALKMLYEERYGITGSPEDKAQLDKYNAILEAEYKKDLEEQEEREDAKRRAWYHFTKGLEKHALVPGSYKTKASSESFINNDKNILVIIDYTAKNAFGVELRQRSGAIYSADGKQFIRLATDKEIR